MTEPGAAPDERSMAGRDFDIDGMTNLSPASTAQPTGAAERLAESVRRVPAGRWSVVSADDVRDVLAEVDRLTAERTEWISPKALARIRQLTEELNQADAALERVRVLHPPVTAEVGLPPSATPRCQTCKVEAPCPTIAALSAPADASEEG